jgi:type VI secretion system FHA domain protein
MTLTLSVLRCPDAVPPETKRITGGEFRIGRGPDNDWIMPDPDRTLSKKHCVVAFRNGGWAIADTSTNGTFINRDAEPIGAGQIRALQNGDRILFGAYEIEVRIEQESSFAQPRPGGAFAASQSSPFDDPFGDDVFATRPPRGDGFTEAAFGGDPLYGGPSPKDSVTMPQAYNPLAPPNEEDFFATPTVPDHSPSFGDAFRPPPVAPKLIPDDDWDLGLPGAVGARPGAAAPAPQSFAPPPQPQAYAPPQSFAAPPPQAYAAAPPQTYAATQPQAFAAPAPQAFAAPPPQAFAAPPPQVFAAPPPAVPPPAAPAYAPPQPAAAPMEGFGLPQAQPAAFAPPPQAAPMDQFGRPLPLPDTGFAAPPPPPPPIQAAPPPPAFAPPPPAASPFAEPQDFAQPPASFAPPPPPQMQPAPPPAAPIPAAPTPSVLSAPGADLLAAFLAGAGMGARQPENPAATMRSLGAAFRATVSGIRQALIARSSIKGEFRIEQTMIRARGNNPLKFSADDDDALSALLGVGRRTDVTPEAAIADALRDMRLHELATVAAMQGGVRALLAGLDPAKLLAEATGGMIPAQKKAKAFEAYEKLHENVTRALADDFDSVFGKAFARAYETALRDITAKDSQ